MQTILIRLEAHNICSKDPLEDVRFERKSFEEVSSWERCVQEPTNSDVDVHFVRSLSEQEWEQHEMDVMYPNLIAVSQVQRYGVCECLICSLVSSEGFNIEGHFVKLVVKQRPDGGVCRRSSAWWFMKLMLGRCRTGKTIVVQLCSLLVEQDRYSVELLHENLLQMRTLFLRKGRAGPPIPEECHIVMCKTFQSRDQSTARGTEVVLIDVDTFDANRESV